MKSKNKNMLVLVAVMGSFMMGTANAAPCHPSGLELFPATYDGGSEDSDLKFLTKDPFLLAIESYELDSMKRIANIHISKKSSVELGKITERFLEKRLAIVLDGVVASAPVIKTKISGQNLAVSFDNQQGFAEFSRILAANADCRS